MINCSLSGAVFRFLRRDETRKPLGDDSLNISVRTSPGRFTEVVECHPHCEPHHPMAARFWRNKREKAQGPSTVTPSLLLVREWNLPGSQTLATTPGGMRTAVLSLPWWTALLKLWAGSSLPSLSCFFFFWGGSGSGGGCVCHSNDKITRTPHAIVHFLVNLCNISDLFLISNAHNLSSLGNGQHQNLLLLKLLHTVVTLTFENLWEIPNYLLIMPLSCFSMSLQRQDLFLSLCSQSYICLLSVLHICFSYVYFLTMIVLPQPCSLSFLCVCMFTIRCVNLWMDRHLWEACTCVHMCVRLDIDRECFPQLLLLLTLESWFLSLDGHGAHWHTRLTVELQGISYLKIPNLGLQVCITATHPFNMGAGIQV